MSVLDLKSFSDTVLLEILVQLAKLKVRYHFMNYKRLAIFGPASLVINLHLALIPIDNSLTHWFQAGCFHHPYDTVGASRCPVHQRWQPFSS